MTSTTKPIHIRINFSSPAFCITAIIVFGIIQQLFIAQVWPGELVGFSTDNHTYMVRLLESRWWEDHGWFNQINAPDGIVLHWTYPLMLLITALALPLQLFMPWQDALIYAGSLCAPLFYLAIGLVIYRLTRYLTTPGWACIAALIVMSARPILNYGTIGRPDHHLLAVLLVCVFWWALIGMDRGKRYSHSLMAGACAALAIWTTPETMAGLVLGIALQSWARIVDHIDGRLPHPIRTCIGGDMLFALSWVVLLLGAIIIDPPYEGRWAAVHDRASIVHICFAGFTGMLIIGRTLIMPPLDRIRHNRLIMQTIGLGILGLLVVAGFIALFPHAYAGAMNHVAPELKTWIANIQEMQPSITPDQLLVNIGAPLLGIFGLLLVWEYRAELTERQKLLTLGAMVTLTLLTMVGTLYFRFAYFAVAAAGPFAALLLIRLERMQVAFLKPDILVPIIIGLPLLVTHIMGALEESGTINYRLFAVPTNAPENKALQPTYTADNRIIPMSHPIGQAVCTNYPMVTYLKEIAPKLEAKWHSPDPMIVMASQNPGPAILFHTDFNIISAPYHRNTDGILDERRFFGTPGTDYMNEVIDRRHIAVAAVCVKPVIDQPELERPGVYDWALNGGDDRFGVALEIPGEWVILARRELLDDWAPVIKQADPDDAEAPATDTDNNSNNSG
ncbi:MAG: hypothetical protein CL558_07320 [Alphaproteobacteria bacterium]|nr:hypothetical protein [Alphaproteobacteria bacterium]MAS47076.1 hypothetical protein [Alphaproteobacteria bacterium]MAX95170.1 hypothetical protein [Alphaproteobacteria bacterium]MBN53375.1 hypothetical protein [Alphaproteobacteria bacterium]OUT41384.1 MAG: hypothetical protein CBB62_03280 [Micavibrio sp. TMED2]|tara:strand:+ start:5974 stop:7998 length:2025 start_codon:yes stop_codon:yes gene_type:complete